MRFAPRALHPIAWWLWAFALGAAALRTTNPFLLGLLMASAWIVVAARRPHAPWARSFGSFVKLGVAVIVMRLVIQILFGVRLPGRELFALPSVDLPDWAAGVTLGGPVTAEALAAAFVEGLQLAVLLACVGAANSLASPYRLLRSMPAVLYELGVAVTVALSFAPQATVSAQRVREARRLRGRPSSGVSGLRGMAVPVLEIALERSLELAASMDSRGYGRRPSIAPGRRRLAQAATLVGALAATIGVYGVLDGAAPGGIGFPLLAIGVVLLVASFAFAGAQSSRTRYRPDPWRAPEWIAVGCGVAALAALVIASNVGVDGLRPTFNPLEVPAVPVLPALAILVAAAPAVLTPAVTQ
ncbi:MAG TPA: energy-coupling factor transporter transmembrane component T [Acidimicrobiales bacterium]|nr:energy-coupling factor transporter transmembrane component T [Acidimicrobiales bacterium]